MKTLIIVASLFSVQPAPAQMDTQWFDLQSMRDQVRAYMVEDVASVSKVLKSNLQEGINVGSKLHDYLYESNVLMANQKPAAVSEEKQNVQVN